MKILFLMMRSSLSRWSKKKFDAGSRVNLLRWMRLVYSRRTCVALLCGYKGPVGLGTLRLVYIDRIRLTDLGLDSGNGGAI